MRTLLAELIARLDPNMGQELRITLQGPDRLNVAISNHIILAGDRDVIIRLLQDGYGDDPAPSEDKE